MVSSYFCLFNDLCRDNSSFPYELADDKLGKWWQIAHRILPFSRIYSNATNDEKCSTSYIAMVRMSNVTHRMSNAFIMIHDCELWK